MYIIKNALRSISRSRGRNILIGIIIFVISLSSCLALSIREAAATAENSALDDLEITASISLDRQAVMENYEDRDAMKEAIGQVQNLSLEELETYAQAESVKNFYYTYSASMNGSSIEAVDSTGTASDETDSTDQEMGQTDMGPGQDRFGGNMGIQGDFTITGYSSDAAMTDFINGVSTITSGAMFAEGESDNTCVIQEELAAYNDLSVGDVITLSNPNAEDETYDLTICGIYKTESAGDTSFDMMSGFSPSADRANQIYVSAQTLEGIITSSEDNAAETTDTSTGRTTTTALQSMLNGTYVFSDIDDYEKFQEEATELGLDDSYTISSSDLTSYEQSLEPLQNLSKYAGYFLIVILVIGGIILVVLNIFNIRERKYEIGVLSAIGMKKSKISLQFLTELLCVTFLALIIGSGIGAVSSVPLTNTLLAQQIESSAQVTQGQNERFGREMNTPGNIPEEPSGEGGADLPSSETTPGDVGGKGGFFGGQVADYVDSVSSAANLTVLIQLIGIGLLLTLVSGLTAIIFILRYDPLRILSNRD